MDQHNLYQRQLLLPGFSHEVQEKLSSASVLVIGAGGLGCPVLETLAATGVGKIGIVDGDAVSFSNLHRQLLYTREYIGKNKAITATGVLKSRFPEITFIPHPIFLNTTHAIELTEPYNLMVDCSDQTGLRYLLSDLSSIIKKPWVFGSIYQFESTLGSFNIPLNNSFSGNYRDVFPTPPASGQIKSCHEAGATTTVTQYTGNLQAWEVIKIITGIGTPLINQVLHTDLLSHSTQIFSYHPQHRNVLSREIFEQTDYQISCSMEDNSIDCKSALDWLKSENTILLDVRNRDEIPPLQNLRHIQIPLSDLENQWEVLKNYSCIITCCQSGIRSQKAASFLAGKNYFDKIYTLETGISNLLDINHA